jgi:chorismate lyase / 3-hydroxybenzoate synthase
MHLLHNQLDEHKAKLDSMAQTQKEHSRARTTSDGYQQLDMIARMDQIVAAERQVITVRSMTAADINQMTDAELARVFFIVGFGVAAPVRALPCGFVSVALPALNGSAPYEVWFADEAVTRTKSAGVSFAKTDSILFGCASIAQRDGDHLEDVTKSLYSQIFDGMDLQAMPYFARAWHYLPAINSAEDALERYRRFSMGRHEAFLAKGRQIERDAPAASALGSQTVAGQVGQLVIYFIATAARGTPIENPRQVSAYRYPEQYGPKSPTFARAFLAPAPQTVFYISGTASIVGHETLHPDDVRAQTRETIANILALKNEAAKRGVDTRDYLSHIKVYVRHATDIDAVRKEIESEFAAKSVFDKNTDIVYFEADICRRDLLVEIELLSAPLEGSL